MQVVAAGTFGLASGRNVIAYTEHLAPAVVERVLITKSAAAAAPSAVVCCSYLLSGSTTGLSQCS